MYMKMQCGEDIQEFSSEYEYENRSDGFYYKEADYNIEPDGTRKQSRMIESFESGRKLAFDGGAPMEVSPGVVVDPITLENLIGGVWKEMTLDNVKNISVDKDGEENSTKNVIISTYVLTFD